MRLLLIPEYSGINKEQRIPDRSKTAHRKPPLKCFLTGVVQLFVTLWTAERQASLSFTISQRLLRLKSIELMMLSTQLILCSPLFLLPSICPGLRVLSNESALSIRWPKYWGFSISPSTEYSGLISFRVYQEAFNRRFPVCCFGSVRNPLFLIYS